MTLRSTAVVSLALLLAGCADAPTRAFGEQVAWADEVHVTGTIVSVERGPGCGILLVGSPVEYRVVSGPEALRGKVVHVLVACIEMPLLAGDARSFEVGATHELVLTRHNVRRIELPALPDDATRFYLRRATVRAAGKAAD